MRLEALASIALSAAVVASGCGAAPAAAVLLPTHARIESSSAGPTARLPASELDSKAHAKPTATGTLAARTTVEVSSSCSGRVTAVFVDWGSIVTKDQSLARIDCSPAVIEAPIDGMVVARHIDGGQTVVLSSSGSSPSTFTIASNLDKLEIVALLDAVGVESWVVGRDADFTVDAFPGVVFHGVVRRAADAAQTVIIDVDDPTLRLLPGMTANVRAR